MTDQTFQSPDGVSQDGLRPFHFTHRLSEQLTVVHLGGFDFLISCPLHEGWSRVAPGYWAAEETVCVECRRAVRHSS